MATCRYISDRKTLFQILIKSIFNTYIEVFSGMRADLAEQMDKLSELTSELEEDLYDYGTNSKMNEKFYA